MLRLRSVCKWAAVAAVAGVTLANGPMTGRGHDAQDKPGDQGPNQAWAHAPDHEPVYRTPTYTDTPEDRMMRELTDDGAHDRSDTQR